MEPLPNATQGLDLIEIPIETDQTPLHETVYEGLTQEPKRLPSYLFYNHRGSRLFEEITELPEYYLTRTELQILERSADDIVAHANPRFQIVEFGSGSSYKTRLLIEAAIRAQGSLTYIPIDISRDFLVLTVEQLLVEYPRLSVTAVAAEYRAGLANLPPSNESRLILFMGSNIGNMTDDEAADFLQCIAEQMRPDDRLLLGADKAKPSEIVEPAYNDAAGVTAKFNVNMLAALNRQIGTDFNLDAFRHHAPYLQEQGHVEMRLVATQDQKISAPDFPKPIDIKQDEFIVTEVSSKYTESRFLKLIDRAGLQLVHEWNDDNDWFTVAMLERCRP